MIRRLMMVVTASLLIVLLLAGCTSLRSSLGTSDSSCYLALPTTSSAVHGHGRLIGIHLFTESSLRKKAPHLYSDLSTTEVAQQHVCVAAYEGVFTSGGVLKPRGKPSGRLAVVVTETPSNKLLGTIIFLRAPLHFGHPHVG
jgi:hypothetical protein